MMVQLKPVTLLLFPRTMISLQAYSITLEMIRAVRITWVNRCIDASRNIAIISVSLYTQVLIQNDIAPFVHIFVHTKGHMFQLSEISHLLLDIWMN